jgi:aerobic-type carbon monoxide dehydrogenase small subunit (CoxS/CutS family)
MPATQPVTLRVNGRSFTREVEPRRHLADFLRHDLGLTGTHIGCEHGACGACTVLLDGAAVRSCLLFAVQVNGAEITTVEGLAGEGALHPLQQAFRDHHGLQCGFCTPGMLMTLSAFLTEHPDADEPAIRDAISGNLCRCTGYESIVDAALAAARQMRSA